MDNSEIRNSFFIQLQGPFKKDHPIFGSSIIQGKETLKRIAIQTNFESAPGLLLLSNKEEDTDQQNKADKNVSPIHQIRLGELGTFAIGATGVLEIHDLDLNAGDLNNSYFLQDEPASTVIDLLIYA